MNMAKGTNPNLVTLQRAELSGRLRRRKWLDTSLVAHSTKPRPTYPARLLTERGVRISLRARGEQKGPRVC
jgi:hypothetical protein